jgi:acyl-CoA reductase-like NAD-dependent aldehyde dehydrogenase
MPSPITCGHLIAGRWERTGEREMRRANPADTSDLVARAPEGGARDAQRAVAGAHAAVERWRKVIPPERGKLVLRAARILEDKLEEVAALLTREQGKLLAESRAEVRRAIDIMEYAAGLGRRLGGQTLPAEAPGVFCYTVRQPIGPVALLTPWNFPVAIPCWKIAPALVCGDPVVFKPSPLTPATAVRVVEIFLEAGIPADVLNLVHGGAEVGTALVDDPRIAGVSFTGSTKVGMAINAAAARRMARTQLEMGGKNPQVVLADADLGPAVDACLTAAFGSTGQRCTATSRAIVEKKAAAEFTDRLAARAAALRLGPGDAAGVEMGPVVDDHRLAEVEGFVERARRDGAEVVVGGRRPEGLAGGHFYGATVVRARPDQEIAREEVFGPVLSVIEAADFDQALAIANSVDYGLCASVFTRDITRALTFVDRIDAGMIHVNRPGLGGFAHFPFGGLKHSSFGAREVGDDTLGFFTDLKSVYIKQE